MKRLSQMLVVLIAINASNGLIAQETAPGLADLDQGWNTITTDGVCSSGTPFQFYAKPSADNENVMIFFNGGGACWFGQACDLSTEPNVHSPFADMNANNPAYARGAFDFENPDNPFADYSIVFVPYCNGDVHIGAGAREYTYQKDGDDVSVTTYHNGYANSTIALNWLYDNFSAPNKVVVSGSSAGAIGGSFYAGLVAEQYPDSPIVLLADGAGGYSSPMIDRVFEAWDVASILPDWSEYSGKSNQSLSFQDFYIASANHNDNLTMAQYNTAEDAVQYNFTYLLGDPQGSFTLPQRLLTNYLDIAQNVEQFAHYTAGGSVHTIMGSDIFYEYSVEGVRFVDWLNDLISGIDVANVSCVNEAGGCSNAPN